MSQEQKEEEERREPLFDDYTFYIDIDVNHEVRDFVIQEEGKIVADLPSEQQEEWIWLVNQRYITLTKENAEKPRCCRVVLQNWINMCMVKKRIVDIRPFLLSSPNNHENQEEKPKRMKAVSYSKDEDDKLLEFEQEYRYKKWTQDKLWEYAVMKALLPDRTASSMERRYRELKQGKEVLDKTNRHFSKENDLALLRWSWCWHKLKRADPTKEESMWEAARQNQVIPGRKPSQMEARYWRVVKKHGGVENALTIAENAGGIELELWYSYFIPKQ